jgi:recombination DNA repair RAD52 pathway protein
MASIKQQQQLKPKVSRVQDHRAKHISTIASKSPDGNGATTDIYVAEEATLSGLLDMIKDTGDDMDDYYGEYYSDQTYFPDSDTEVSTDRMIRSATVEEKLDDALKTWEQTSSRRAHPHFQ